MRSAELSTDSPSSRVLSPEFEAVDRAFFEALRPPERLTVTEWADRYRILSGRAASEPGKWHTSRTPYLAEIMDALSPNSRVETVVFMGGGQIGKTELGNNWVGHTIDQAPGGMLIVWPDLEIARKNSKLRIQPLIDSTPCLRAKVRPHRERDAGNTILSKEFPGGILLITGAESTSGLKSVPVGKLFADEVDEYAPDVGGQGDPLELALVRTRNFPNRKRFITSTPTIAGRSRIEKLHKAGDQRRYELPCPFCAKFQALEWKNLRWDEGEPESVRYYCSGCGAAIEEQAHKTDMLAGGRWVATNPKPAHKTRSYHLSALYSPIPWYSWPQAARDFTKAMESPETLLRVFVNTVWGEPWKEKGEAPEWERLFNRRENYQPGTVPRGGLILTSGADVQKDRIEVEIRAWGRGLEQWLVDYQVFPGDTEGDSPWKALEDFLAQTFPHEGGARLPVRMAAIDASYNQNRVMSWIRTQPTNRTMAVKGFGNFPVTVGQPKAVDIEHRGKKVFNGAKLWPVGVSIVKGEIYGWLRGEQPTDPSKGFPRGFVHFPMLPDEYFRQLCAEELRKKTHKGYLVTSWEKTRDRNEALDCAVYSRAAAAVLGIERIDEAGWRKLERALGLVRKPKAGHDGPAPAAEPSKGAPVPVENPERPITRPDFWSSWRHPGP